MKTLMMIALGFFTLLVYAQNSDVEITPFQNVEIAPYQTARINCPAGPPREVAVGNTSGKVIGVAVVDTATGKQVRGFGLGQRAWAEVSIAEGQVLELTNSTAKKRLVKVRFGQPQSEPVADLQPEPAADPERYINFTLHNSSLQSIPLVIPGVMNPNLSPLSDSGVGLQMGQPVYFRQKGKDILLFKVDENIREGERIDVAELIRERKQELGN